MNDQKDFTWLWLAVIGLLIFSRVNGCQFLPSVIAPSQTTQVTYVYEKDSGGVPSFVGAALNALNRREPPILATPFEEDTTDNDSQVPDQYKIALEAARKSGLPALVVQAGDKVVKAVKDPKPEDFESVK
jgi:hypothetical protein